MTARQKDLLLLQLCQHEFPADGVLALPLHTSEGWSKMSGGDVLPTQVPNSQFWLVQRRRLQLGVEAVMLQGCDIVDIPTCRPGVHRNNFLQDLAGSVFCVYQFVAWFVACLAVTPLNQHQQERHEGRGRKQHRGLVEAEAEAKLHHIEAKAEELEEEEEEEEEEEQEDEEQKGDEEEQADEEEEEEEEEEDEDDLE